MGKYRAKKKDMKVIYLALTLRIVVVLFLIFALLRGDFQSAFTCALTLVLFSLPSFLEKTIGVRLPTALEIVIFLFIFCSQILGELNSYYIRYPFWDSMLHTVNGFICAAIGFALIDILNDSPKTKLSLSPLYLALFAFCFSMTVGVMWEFFEFFVDMLLKKDMQKDRIIHDIYTVILDETRSNKVVRIENIIQTLITAENGESIAIDGYIDVGIYDTMKDLLVNFIGALVFCVLGFFHVKYRSSGRIAKSFMPVVEGKQDDIDKEENAQNQEKIDKSP